MLSQELPIWSGSSIAGFSAVVTPNGRGAYYAGTGSGVITTGTETCVVSGGTPPYTYLWVIDSGDPQIHATNPVSASTTFYAGPPPNVFAYETHYYCRVTDSTAAVVHSNIVPIIIERNT